MLDVYSLLEVACQMEISKELGFISYDDLHLISMTIKGITADVKLRRTNFRPWQKRC